jgi:hypothetical protein
MMNSDDISSNPSDWQNLFNAGVDRINVSLGSYSSLCSMPANFRRSMICRTSLLSTGICRLMPLARLRSQEKAGAFFSSCR